MSYSSLPHLVRWPSSQSLQNIKYVTTHTVEYWAERLSSELRSCIAMDQGDFFSLGIGTQSRICFFFFSAGRAGNLNSPQAWT